MASDHHDISPPPIGPRGWAVAQTFFCINAKILLFAWTFINEVGSWYSTVFFFFFFLGTLFAQFY